MFSHQFSDAEATFVELTTDWGIIRLSPGHYLYADGDVIQADRVEIGDYLDYLDYLDLDNAPLSLPTIRVTGIANVRAIGLFNPHTLHGDVIVDGFRTTTYTDAIHPTLAHALLAPLRALYQMNVTFGL